MDERYEKLAKLLSDEKEAAEIISESVEETQKNLAARGLEFTIAELKEFGKAVTAANAQGELDEDALEGVSGGSVLGAAVIGARVAFNSWSYIHPIIKRW